MCIQKLWCFRVFVAGIYMYIKLQSYVYVLFQSVSTVSVDVVMFQSGSSGDKCM